MKRTKLCMVALLVLMLPVTILIYWIPTSHSTIIHAVPSTEHEKGPCYLDQAAIPKADIEHRPRICAHKAYCTELHEDNKRKSIEECMFALASRGVKCFDVDVFSTSDHTLFVGHLADVAKLLSTDADTLQTWTRTDLWNSQAYMDGHVPLLEKVINWAVELEVQVNLEMKGKIANKMATFQRSAPLFGEATSLPDGQCQFPLITPMPSSAALRKDAPYCRSWPVRDSLSCQLPFGTVSARDVIMPSITCAASNDHSLWEGAEIWTWPINTQECLHKAALLHADVIITDKPIYMLELYRRWDR